MSASALPAAPLNPRLSSASSVAVDDTCRGAGGADAGAGGGGGGGATGEGAGGSGGGGATGEGAGGAEPPLMSDPDC